MQLYNVRKKVFILRNILCNVGFFAVTICGFFCGLFCFVCFCRLSGEAQTILLVTLVFEVIYNRAEITVLG